MVEVAAEQDRWLPGSEPQRRAALCPASGLDLGRTRLRLGPRSPVHEHDGVGPSILATRRIRGKKKQRRGHHEHAQGRRDPSAGARSSIGGRAVGRFSRGSRGETPSSRSGLAPSRATSTLSRLATVWDSPTRTVPAVATPTHTHIRFGLERCHVAPATPRRASRNPSPSSTVRSVGDTRPSLRA
jgi:hypothetical protein